MASRGAKIGRIVLIVITILLIIAVIVLRFVDRIPQAWSKKDDSVYHSSVPVAVAGSSAKSPESSIYSHKLPYSSEHATVPSGSAQFGPASGASATTSKSLVANKATAKLMILLLAERHCPMGCPDARFGTVHLFIQKAGGALYYLSSLEVSQYGVFYLPPGSYTLYAQLTDDDHLRLRQPVKNGIQFGEFKNTSVDFVTSKWLLNLKAGKVYPLRIVESKGAFDRRATLQISALKRTEAIHYFKHDAVLKAGKDNYLQESDLQQLRYAGLVPQPTNASSLLRFRYINCQVPLKSGQTISCNYDFLQENTKHHPVLLSQDKTCPAFSTLKKSGDLGWGVRCKFVGGVEPAAAGDAGDAGAASGLASNAAPAVDSKDEPAVDSKSATAPAKAPVGSAAVAAALASEVSTNDKSTGTFNNKSKTTPSNKSTDSSSNTSSSTATTSSSSSTGSSALPMPLRSAANASPQQQDKAQASTVYGSKKPTSAAVQADIGDGKPDTR